MKNGKAFEYACIISLCEAIKSDDESVYINDNRQLRIAESFFNSTSRSEQEELIAGANTAVNLILPLEPNLLYGSGPLFLEMASDARAIGIDGDVRDVLCFRRDSDWNVGISCKHNHSALRHPRITEGKDFGSDWIGFPCSDTFIEEITPIIDYLSYKSDQLIVWSGIERKQEKVYVPILEAYKNEIERMCEEDSSVPERLLSYFFGANDFYKVIMDSRRKTTTIEGFNMHGTLNRPCGKEKPLLRVPVTKMPKRLIDISFKPASKTTIILTFDNGWAITMRLHNKDRRVRATSLAWDVNILGLPPTTYVNTRSWFE